jgi:predicted Rossmann fold nucleotide-binding protein DprA/Smf involved in DNA uptake
MTRVNQGSLAVLAMTNRLTDIGVPPLKASELWRLLARVDDPGGLLGLDERAASELTSGTDVDAARLVRLLDAGVALAARLERLYERGISVITALDEAYPHRLRERLALAAPPVLYCAGDISLLGVDGIGIVGSRNVGPEAIEVSRKVAHLVAESGLPVVSGGAKGVDSISMAAAYETGGTAVGVLADSLDRAIGRADNRRAMLEERACLCTPYRPDARFTAGTAMGRNKIIYGLARVTLVISSAKDEGGTWAGATEALGKKYGHVAVWTGEGAGPGNDALVKAGGTAIERPEAILSLDTVEFRDHLHTSQMELGFGAPSKTTESVNAPQATPSEVGARPDDPTQSPTSSMGRQMLDNVIRPQATGVCWCGCGKTVEDGAFFVSRHAPGAAQRAVIKHFGSVEAFLAVLGEVPEGD